MWFAQANTGEIGAITASGQVNEYPVGGQPEFTAAGSKNSVWFTAYGAVGRLESSGRFALYPVSGGVPFGIARGSDGAMWFTEGDVGKIGRITDSGKLQEFDLPDPDSFPFGIALGSDGALWFAEENKAKIGRIAPSECPDITHPIDSRRGPQSSRRHLRAPRRVAPSRAGHLTAVVW